MWGDLLCIKFKLHRFNNYLFSQWCISISMNTRYREINWLLFSSKYLRDNLGVWEQSTKLTSQYALRMHVNISYTTTSKTNWYINWGNATPNEDAMHQIYTYLNPHMAIDHKLELCIALTKCGDLENGTDVFYSFYSFYSNKWHCDVA